MSGPFTSTIRVPPTETETQAMRIAREVLETGARRVRKRFDSPDDDWQPVWLILRAHGEGSLITGNAHKHAMTDLVAELARREGAVAIGHLHSSWIVDNPTPEVIEAIRAAGGSTEGFERSEVLHLFTYTAGSIDLRFAKIIRHEGRPPTLGAFEAPPGELSNVHGRMMTPLQRAVRRIG